MRHGLTRFKSNVKVLVDEPDDAVISKDTLNDPKVIKSVELKLNLPVVWSKVACVLSP